VAGFLPRELQDAPVVEDRIECCDTHAFREIGVPTLFPAAARRTNPRPWPHLPTDTVDIIDPDRLQTVGRLAFALVDAAQNGRARLP